VDLIQETILRCIILRVDAAYVHLVLLTTTTPEVFKAQDLREDVYPRPLDVVPKDPFPREVVLRHVHSRVHDPLVGPGP
jgi:hypothetical protein